MSTFFNEKGEEVKLAECGTYCALNEYERYKSWAFVDYSYILYEEFITDGVYLNDEPRLLQQFVSTVARLKRITVILIGNTLSRVCPYFNEWCLEGVLKQKQGTIEVYHFHQQVLDDHFHIKGLSRLYTFYHILLYALTISSTISSSLPLRFSAASFPVLRRCLSPSLLPYIHQE